MGHQIGVLRRAPRGDRFQELHRRRNQRERGRLRCIASLASGMLLVAVGLVTYPVPGPPSTLMILIGLTLIAQEWLWAARSLDRLEMRLHAWHHANVLAWRRLTGAMKALIGFVCVTVLATFAAGLYLLLAAG
jgi:hypothetical protein